MTPAKLSLKSLRRALAHQQMAVSHLCARHNGEEQVERERADLKTGKVGTGESNTRLLEERKLEVDELGFSAVCVKDNCLYKR
ncbi:hypothetical protein PFLUV_G00139240 [Perca fluviatilis]|uniref:Uncharacterized protein n=1 Tax=Perca fluviatilis TaxID=8168 RepID=A0A6A5F630_PERFL|nr:hypothetical protein PFLUV_G00139240 [Perca fluviatilis]